jgi:hypothetical protein
VQKITATIPLTAPPSWAMWQRQIFDALGDSVHPFWARYCRDDGELLQRFVDDPSYSSPV